jgi:hypothetical protein
MRYRVVIEIEIQPSGLGTSEDNKTYLSNLLFDRWDDFEIKEFIAIKTKKAEGI